MEITTVRGINSSENFPNIGKDRVDVGNDTELSEKSIFSFLADFQRHITYRYAVF